MYDLVVYSHWFDSLFHFKTKSLGKLFAYIYLSSIVWYWSVNGQWCPMTRKVMM